MRKILALLSALLLPAVALAQSGQLAPSSIFANPTGSTAYGQSVTLGTNLSFSGNVLNATGGGGVSSVTGTAPIVSSGGSTPAISLSGVTSEQGNGAKVQLSTGTTTLNDCVKYDANGNAVDAGVPCGSGSGSVTSVGLSMPGIFTVTGSPVTTAGTLTATAAGTSGGIPYFSSSTGLASSAALTANLPVIGGGAGVAPTVGTVTGNTTKFATSTGTLTTGHCVQIDASGNFIDSGAACGGGGGSGTVTSVGLALPAIFSVSGSPVTTSGTLTGSLANESANTIFAGPTSGGATTPTFRPLVAADLPSTLLNLGPGLTATLGTQNSTPVSAGGTVYPQLWTFSYSANHTVASSEIGGLLIGTGSSNWTLTLPAANSAGFQQGQAVCFMQEGTGTVTVASPSSTAVNGITSVGQNGSVCITSDGSVANTWHSAGWGGGLAASIAFSSAFTNSGNTLDLAANGVALSKIAQIAGGTVLGNTGTSNATPAATTTPVLGIPGTSNGTITLAGATAGSVTLGSNANVATPYTVKFPAAQCGSGQTYSNDGSGNLSCASAGSGSVTSVAPGPGATTSATGASGTTTAITGTGTISPDTAWFVGTMGGLVLSNDGTSPNTVIDVASGSAASDDQTYLMALKSAYTKTTGAWALGTGSGCLDTGSVAASTWYHVFLIERSDTQVTDLLCSTSATSPTMPTNYNKKRRVGSFKTNGSSNILAFKQVGSVFYWAASVLDVNDSALSTSNKLETLGSVPPGVKVRPLCRYTINNATNAVLLTSPDEDTSAPSTTNPFTAAPGFDQIDNSLTAGDQNSVCPEITTNTSQQVNARATAASTTLAIVTRGWAETSFGNTAAQGAGSFSWYYQSPGTFTWTKPSGITWVYAQCVGGGGGGGGGAENAASTITTGGAGGGAGSYQDGWIQASAAGSTETVTVGAGGTAGAAAGGTTTVGGDGGAGGDSSFGSWVVAYAGGAAKGGQLSGIITGAGGSAGLKGDGANGTAGSSGANGSFGATMNSAIDGVASAGPSGAASGGAGGAANPTANVHGPSAGGSAAGITAANATNTGGNGAIAWNCPVGASGGAAGVSGTAGTSNSTTAPLHGGCGGGAGGSSTTAPGGGGAGGAPGGGGGGAAATQNGGTPAAGGAGGRGECRVFAG